jgi:hypothetical protein
MPQPPALQTALVLFPAVIFPKPEVTVLTTGRGDFATERRQAVDPIPTREKSRWEHPL